MLQGREGRLAYFDTSLIIRLENEQILGLRNFAKVPIGRNEIVAFYFQSAFFAAIFFEKCAGIEIVGGHLALATVFVEDINYRP